MHWFQAEKIAAFGSSYSQCSHDETVVAPGGCDLFACMDMSTRDSRAFYPSGISPLVFLFASCVPIMAAFFAQ